MSEVTVNKRFHPMLAGVCFLILAIFTSPLQAATPVVSPPYTLAVFATSTPDYSQPDSIVQWHDRILIGFSNGVAKDGSDGKSSTIVEYSLSGKAIRTFSVPIHSRIIRTSGA